MSKAIDPKDELSAYIEELIEQSRLDDEIQVGRPGERTRRKFQESSVAELVSQYEAIATQLYDDRVKSSVAKKLYYHLEAIEAELKSRPADQRRRLAQLLADASPGARLSAAIATLTFDRKRSIQVLKQIEGEEDFPADAQARGLLRALATGRYVPK